MDDFSFGIEGLKMHGAASRRNEIYLEERDVIVTELSTVRLRWIKKTDEKQKKMKRDYEKASASPSLRRGGNLNVRSVIMQHQKSG